MQNKAAIETLALKRIDLITERDRMLARFNAEISQIESAIETLSGKKVWELDGEGVIYDDESPHYIKSSIED